MWSNPKQEIYRNENLLWIVSLLPCVSCGIHGYSQAAHIGGVKEGKGMGLKVPDSLIAALCGPHPSPLGPTYPNVPGCHNDLDEGRIDRTRGYEFIARTYVMLVEHAYLKVIPRRR
jgi:hypothetical protein